MSPQEEFLGYLPKFVWLYNLVYVLNKYFNATHATFVYTDPVITFFDLYK